MPRPPPLLLPMGQLLRAPSTHSMTVSPPQSAAPSASRPFLSPDSVAAMAMLLPTAAASLPRLQLLVKAVLAPRGGHSRRRCRRLKLPTRLQGRCRRLQRRFQSHLKPLCRQGRRRHSSRSSYPYLSCTAPAARHRRRQAYARLLLLVPESRRNRRRRVRSHPTLLDQLHPRLSAWPRCVRSGRLRLREKRSCGRLCKRNSPWCGAKQPDSAISR